MGNENSHSTVEAGQGDAGIENNLKMIWRKVPHSGVSISGRDGHCACACGGRVYVFGGVVETADGGYTESNDLLVFDLETESWSAVDCSGDIPLPRSSASITAVGDCLFLFGGLSQTRGWMSGVFMFDTGKNTWKELNVSGSGPSPRDKLATAAIGHTIYVFGGFGPVAEAQDEDADIADDDDEEEDEDDAVQNGLEATQEAAKFGWFDDLFALDTVSLSWSQPLHLNKTQLTPRAAHTLCAVADNLVIFGGRDSTARKNDLYVFNTAARKWLNDLHVTGRRPAPRSFHAACTIGHRVIVTGGRGVSNEHFNDVHVLDTETWQWLQPAVESELLTPRGLHAMTVVGGNLVVFGGSSDFDPETMQCQTYLADTYVSSTEDLLSGKATASVAATEENSLPKSSRETESASGEVGSSSS